MRFIYSKTFRYFFILLVAAALLIVLHISGWLKPVESTIAEIPRPVVYVFSEAGKSGKSFFSFFGSVRKLSIENTALKNQVIDLQEQTVSLQEYKVENAVLEKELNYRQTVNYNLVSANVIARDPIGYSQTITLDIGNNQGISVGDAVIAQGVLIGKISSVQSFTSKALLITDPTSAIDAQLSASGIDATLRGSFGSGIVLSEIPQNTPVHQGDLVISAGLTGKIPHGLLIGTISDIQTPANALLQTATVLSGVDLKNLLFVAVIKS